MLNRTEMITALTEGVAGNHDRLFALRRDLHKLGLPALASRYTEKTGLSVYDGTPLCKEILPPEPPTSEEIDELCQVPAD